MFELKPIPRSILIFGAGDHIGGPLATFLQREAPRIKLRLATSQRSRIEPLKRQFPSAEVIVADYFDLPSLKDAVAGMEGVFVLTRSGTNERPAMENLVAALKEAGTILHLLRLVSLLPEANPRRIPRVLRDQGLGLPIQHAIAKTILDESDLPVTYLNIGSTFMDNFLKMTEGLSNKRTLIWPEHKVLYIHPTDIAEVAGRLFLSEDGRHIGQFHSLNNGHDLLQFQEVAQLMSTIWGEPIAYDGTKAGFFEAYASAGKERLQYLWDFFEYIRANEFIYARSDFVERIIGRKPTTLASWIKENKNKLLGL